MHGKIRQLSFCLCKVCLVTSLPVMQGTEYQFVRMRVQTECPLAKGIELINKIM